MGYWLSFLQRQERISGNTYTVISTNLLAQAFVWLGPESRGWGEAVPMMGEEYKTKGLRVWI